MGMPCGSLLGFPLCAPPECMRSLGSLPHSITSNGFDQEMWDMFVEAVSICCFLPVPHWARGSWASMSLPLSSSWMLGQSSRPNLDCPVVFPRAPSEKFHTPEDRCIRTFGLLHPFLRNSRRVLQKYGTRFRRLLPTHGGSRCRPSDEASDLQGRRSTGADLRRIHDKALRLLGGVRPRARTS